MRLGDHWRVIVCDRCEEIYGEGWVTCPCEGLREVEVVAVDHLAELRAALEPFAAAYEPEERDFTPDRLEPEHFERAVVALSSSREAGQEDG
jgi:hypothetical protein